MDKQVVLVSSDYVLRQVLINPNASMVTQLFKRLKDTYGDCIYTSVEVEIAKELIGTLPLFLDSSDRYNQSLTDYQIVRDTLSKGDVCVLYRFSVVQLQTFAYDFSKYLDKIYICNDDLSTVLIKEYLTDIGSASTPIQMQPLTIVDGLDLKIRYYNGVEKCCTIYGESHPCEGDFSCFTVIPQNNHSEVTLKILTKDEVKYSATAFSKLTALSVDGNITSSIRSILPDFLVYSDGACVGYGYDTPPNTNVTRLKDYLTTKANTDDQKRTLRELLKVAKKFLCTAKVFQSYDMYYYNMDLEDFKVVFDSERNVVDVLPLGCESICIEGVATNDRQDRIVSANIKNISERYNVNRYQSYLFDICTMYVALKIITLSIDDKDYKLLKDSIGSLKFSCNQCIREAFNTVSWHFFDEIGDVCVDNAGHICTINIVKILNLCEFEHKSILGNLTKKTLFSVSVTLTFVCVISLIVILYLIL